VAEALAFHFQPGTSVLHRFDPRFETVSLLLLSPSIMVAFPAGLIVLSAILVISIWSADLNWRFMVYELRYFGILLAVVFFSRAVFTPGLPVIGIGSVQVTDQGLLSGFLFCWRLILVAVSGLIFAATTRSKEIQVAVSWLLAPVPYLPEKRIGIMIGLVIRFIPMVLDQAIETNSVQNARCIQCRKNPYYRLTRFAMPLLRRTLKQADRLVVAMTARCYDEARTPPAMNIQPADWWMLCIVFCLCAALIGSNIFT
jgi:energy-coupling factor transporter transmembrane protein EcfT